MSSIRKGVSLTVAGLSLAQIDVVSAVASDPKGLSVMCDGKMDEDGKFVSHAPGKVNQLYRCPQCEDEGTIANFKLRGAIKGKVVTMFSEEDVASLEASDDLKLNMKVNVHRSEDVESMLPTGTSYFLSCPAGQNSAYRLFVETIKARGDLALMTTWAARSKASLYRMIVREDALMIQQLAWPADRKDVPTVDGNADVKQVNLLTQLLDGSVEDFDVAEYVDAARAKVETVIAEGEAVPVAGATEDAKTAAVPVSLDLTMDLTRLLETRSKAVKPTKTPAKRAAKKVLVDA